MLPKTDQLFIRACKSLNPGTRLRSVYHRFYGKYHKETENVAIGSILTGIVDDNFPMSVGKYLRERSSYLSYLCISKEVASEHEITLWIMRDHLRHLERAWLDALGVSSPAKFRNKGKIIC